MMSPENSPGRSPVSNSSVRADSVPRPHFRVLGAAPGDEWRCRFVQIRAVCHLPRPNGVTFRWYPSGPDRTAEFIGRGEPQQSALALASTIPRALALGLSGRFPPR